MLKEYIKGGVVLMAICLAVSLTMVSCDNDDDNAGSKVELLSFGPSVLRGEQLRFIGTNLNRITSIVLPDNVEVPASSFMTQTATLIVIQVPDDAAQGFVTLRSPEGDIVTKTPLGILEPIVITSVTPSTVRPGEVISITGTYLNLITEVVFATNKSVTDFESQSKTSITVRVPEDAQTGAILLLDDETIPNVIESDDELIVKLPVATSISPNPVKAGSNITITGTDLDLTTGVELGGSQVVDSADFVSQSATEIVMTVPADTDDGKISLIAGSSQKTESEDELVMVVPTVTTITGVGPDLAKNDQIITVNGTDLDLVTSVTFGGDKQANVEAGGTQTQITVKVPVDATEGIVSFNTASGKSASSPASLALVKPAITSFTPTTVETEDEPSITINGTDLDLVKEVVFGGDWSTDASGSASQIVVDVVPGSVTGKVTLITVNGTEVISSQTLTIVPDVPNITGYPPVVFEGTIITLTGTNMNVPADIIFPGDKKATVFGSKTATTIEVYVPMGVAIGEGKIKFVTTRNEVYESPVIDFKGGIPALAITMYDETIGFGGGSWSWGGTAETASVEQAYTGDVSFKHTTSGSDGGASAGGMSGVDASGMSVLKFALYGGPGTDGKQVAAVLGSDGSDNWDSYNSVTLNEGEWTEYSIPLTSYPTVNLANVTRWIFKVEGATDAVIYVDRVGFD